MLFHMNLRIAAVLQEFSLVFLFYTSLLLHHSIDFRLAYAGHFGHVSFHLVAITLLSRWLQPTATADPATPNTIQWHTRLLSRPWNPVNHTPARNMPRQLPKR
jgi:hypothetical protein